MTRAKVSTSRETGKASKRTNSNNTDPKPETDPVGDFSQKKALQISTSKKTGGAVLTDDSLIEEYCKRIRSLLSQSRLSFLIGAGCSCCAGLPLMTDLTEKICDALKPENASNSKKGKAFELLKDIVEKYRRVNNISIEDYLSELQDFHAILRRQVEKGISKPVFSSKSGKFELKHVESLIGEVKKEIAKLLDTKKIKTLEHHQSFCRIIHKIIRQGRERTGQPVNYFLLNYDTLFEDAMSLEKVSYDDGFIGGSTAWWNPKKTSEFFFEKEKIKLEARIFKLHGSIDWVRPEGHDFPMRIRQSLIKVKRDVIGTGEPIVIFPSLFKYKETQHDPYAQLLMIFRKCLSQTQSNVLAIVGYGFNDEHINVEINESLKISNGKLTVLIFLGKKRLPNSLKKIIENKDICSQVLVLGKNEIWERGELIHRTKNEIEWYKFEKIGDILMGGKI